MDSSFSPAIFASKDDDENGSQMRHQQFSSGASSALAESQLPKKRKNQNPNPEDVEVIALSPTTLMAKNKFVCEVCNKGFQREQNLQLHRRGHNLPWKLKQKGPKEVKRKLYLCPETTCPHHDPTRALGDLTGIKKHFLRKHGEKRFNCDKCSKKYAVLSDCNAHTKICGTKDYRCDCGTIFSRRDSFVTHRTFCDALTKENGRTPMNKPPSLIPNGTTRPLNLSHISTPHEHQPLARPHHGILRLDRPGPQRNMLMSPSFQSGSSMQHDALMNPPFQSIPGPKLQPSQPLFLQAQVSNHIEENQVPIGLLPPKQSSFDHSLMQITDQLPFDSNNNAAANSSFTSLLNLSFFPSNGTNNTGTLDIHHSGFGEDPFNFFTSGNLMSAAIPSLYSTSAQAIQNPSTVHMSATALLQKAAQFGSTSSTNLGATIPLMKFFDTYQPKSFNADNFEAFGDNSTGHLHDLINSVASGSSSSIFGDAYNENVQDMDKEDQFYGDRLNDNIAAFDGEGIEFGSLEPDDGLTRDFLGMGQQMANTNVGDMDVSSLDSQAGNTSTSLQSQDFGGPDFE